MPHPSKDRTGPVEEIVIDGFQALVGVRLRLASGVNVVVGESDVGKSAIVRALQGAISNQRGDGFVNNRTGQCAVSVAVDDDVVCWRKPENEYQINDDEPFRKVGISVPGDVGAILNMAPLQLDKNSERSINIVGQDDPKFLVRDKETDIARTIGAITRLQPVYNAMCQASSDRRAAAGRAKTLDVEASQLRLRLAAFADLDAEAKRLKRSQAVLAKCRALCEKLEALRSVAERLAVVVAAAAAIELGLARASAVLSAAKHAKAALGFSKVLLRLSGLRTDQRAAASVSAQLSLRIASVVPVSELDISAIESDSVRFALLMTIMARLEANAGEAQEVGARIASMAATTNVDLDALFGGAGRLVQLQRLQDSLTACKKGAAVLQDGVKAADDRLGAASSSIAAMLKTTSVCPLSGGRLFDECRRLIGEAI